MNQPADLKSRIKIAVLILIGGAAVLYAVIHLVVKPMAEKTKQGKQHITELSGRLDEAEREIKRSGVVGKEYTGALRNIRDASDQHLLHPRLGNYLLSATEILEAHAEAVGVKLDSVTREGEGSRALARIVATHPNTIKAYTVRVSTRCEFGRLCELLSRIESANPYVCIVSLNVAAQSQKNKDKHVTTFSIQWPVWADPEMPDKVAERLQQAEEELEKQNHGNA